MGSDLPGLYRETAQARRPIPPYRVRGAPHPLELLTGASHDKHVRGGGGGGRRVLTRMGRQTDRCFFRFENQLARSNI